MTNILQNIESEVQGHAGTFAIIVDKTRGACISEKAQHNFWKN
jgi:hypothetical protein